MGRILLEVGSDRDLTLMYRDSPTETHPDHVEELGTRNISKLGLNGDEGITINANFAPPDPSDADPLALLDQAYPTVFDDIRTLITDARDHKFTLMRLTLSLRKVRQGALVWTCRDIARCCSEKTVINLNITFAKGDTLAQLNRGLSSINAGCELRPIREGGYELLPIVALGSPCALLQEPVVAASAVSTVGALSIQQEEKGMKRTILQVGEQRQKTMVYWYPPSNPNHPEYAGEGCINNLGLTGEPYDITINANFMPPDRTDRSDPVASLDQAYSEVCIDIRLLLLQAAKGTLTLNRLTLNLRKVNQQSLTLLCHHIATYCSDQTVINLNVTFAPGDSLEQVNDILTRSLPARELRPMQGGGCQLFKTVGQETIGFAYDPPQEINISAGSVSAVEPTATSSSSLPVVASTAASAGSEPAAAAVTTTTTTDTTSAALVPAAVTTTTTVPVPTVSAYPSSSKANASFYSAYFSQLTKADQSTAEWRVPTWLRLACLAATGVFALAVPILGAVDQVSDNPFDARLEHLDAMQVFWAGFGLALIGFVGQTLHDRRMCGEHQEKTRASKWCDTVMISGLALLFAYAAWTLMAGYIAPTEAMASSDSFTKHLFTGLYSVFGAAALGAVVCETVSACGKERDAIRGRLFE